MTVFCRVVVHVLLVLHDHLDPNAGGGGTVLGLGERYRARGHRVQYRSFDSLPRRLSHNAKTLVFPSYLLWRLGMDMRRDPPDVLDSSLGDTWLWARTLRRRTRRPPLLVARSHGLAHLAHIAELEEVRLGRKTLSWRYPLYWGGFRLWEVTQTLRHADVALFLNPAERDFALAEFGISAAHAHVVPNGIPDAFLASKVEAAPDAGGGRIGIAQVGGWRYLKGIRNSAESLTEVLGRHPEVHASLLGTQTAADEVLRSFPTDLRERVRVVPSFPRADLPRLLQGHHIKLFPVLAEGFGLALLEAMACGLAPVTTPVGGPGTLVRDGENGLLVAPARSDALTMALERLLEDRPLLRHLQGEAWASARRYGLTRVADETLAVYRDALQRRNSNGVA